MPQETEKFVFLDVVYGTLASDEQPGDRHRRPPRKAGLQEADIACKHCEHVWRAEAKDLLPSIGGVTVKCPKCGETERVPSSALG